MKLLKTNYLKSILILINLSIISYLVLFDPRSHLLSEPYKHQFLASAIAISFLKFDIAGLYGLKEIYDFISESPKIWEVATRYYAKLGHPLVNFQNLGEMYTHNEKVNDIIINAQNIKIDDYNNIALFQFNITYVIYFILAFLIFGIELYSLSYLFLLFITQKRLL